RDGRVHAPQPRVALDGSDPERGVTHPQPRMSTPVGVGARATPVLLEEHPQSVLGTLEVVRRVQLTQYFVLGNLSVKARHNRMESLGSADGVVEGLPHLIHHLHCGASPR